MNASPLPTAPSSLPPDSGTRTVSPWREGRVLITELAALAVILTLALKGIAEGHYALLGIVAVLMRSLSPFFGERK